MANKFSRNDIHVLERQIGECKSFAAYIRRLIMLLAALPDTEQKPLANEDRVFLEALNRYLISEGQLPIQIENVQALPSIMGEALRQMLDRKRLSEKPNVSNCGSDSRSRGNDPARHLSLGYFYQALNQYIFAKNQQISIDEPELKLWRKDVESASETQLAKHRYEEIKNIDFANQTIVIVPGSSSTHQRMDIIIPYFSHVERVLGGKHICAPHAGKKIQLYSLSFPNRGGMEQYADAHFLNADPNHYYTPMVAEWVNEVLLPSLKVNENAAPDVPNLKKSLRKLTFYSISYGSVIVIQIRNAMAARLKALGYADEEIRHILPQVTCLHNNPVTRIDAPLPEIGSFSSIFAASPHDLLAQSFVNYEVLVPDGEAAPTSCKINRHTQLLWRESPDAGINLDILEQGDDDLTSKRWMVPSGSLTLPKHNADLMAANLMEPLKHGAWRLHYAAPLQNALRRMVSSDDMPDNLYEVFEPSHLDDTDEHKRQRHSMRTAKAFGVN